MPLPIAHSLAGVAFSRAQPLHFFKKKWQDVFFIIVLSNAADFDFLPGFLIGNPSLYHHGFFHTLGASLVVGSIGGFFFSRDKGKFWKYAVVIALIYYFHVVMDYLTEDKRPPFGVLLFWPFSQEYFISSFLVFKKVIRSNDSFTFFQSLFNPHNFAEAWRECWVMGILIGFVEIKNKLFSRGNSKDQVSK
jgi:inner membrane protein